jgi:hypothetical protein
MAQPASRMREVQEDPFQALMQDTTKLRAKAEVGLTDRELADYFGVEERTLTEHCGPVLRESRARLQVRVRGIVLDQAARGAPEALAWVIHEYLTPAGATLIGDSGQDPVGWLRDLLVDGHPVDRREVLGRARAAGFGERVVERAAVALGVVKQQSGFGSGRRSHWSLPQSRRADGNEPALRLAR